MRGDGLQIGRSRHALRDRPLGRDEFPDDETVADPDLVEEEDGDEKEDKPEVVGDEVDLEEIGDDDDDDEEENDDTLIENVDDDDSVADIIDKDEIDKE